jgi:uncharacterized protein (UPF0248 family)
MVVSMTPIQELLNRIRWDEEYGKADFSVGYYDRVEEKLIKVSFRELYFEKEDHFAFQIIDEEGETHNIPLHRVKELYRNGKCIWHRDY